MKVLVLAPDYPKPGRLFGGIFNERCAIALRELCEDLEVLVPRPFAPPLLSALVSRWRIHASTAGYEVRHGVSVHRPAFLHIPRLGGAFSYEMSTFFCCRNTAREMQSRKQFDVILSFDLVGAGGLAWRLGRDLGIPATGWATGDDVRFAVTSSYGQAVIRALERLDSVFYQNHELLEKAAALTGISSSEMASDRHLVLSRGIPAPPRMPRDQLRKRRRAGWGVRDDQVVVMSIGRICRAKGIFELIDAVSLACHADPRITCVMVGSSPGYDETALVQKTVQESPGAKVRLLPHCDPDEVWEYLCAADIFAFASHNEGMPNSLLEAMVMGVPAIAFGIPPVLEIEAGTGALVVVPPFSSSLFSESIVHLAASRGERLRIGKEGRNRVMDSFMVRKNMAVVFDRLSELVQRQALVRR